MTRCISISSQDTKPSCRKFNLHLSSFLGMHNFSSYFHYYLLIGNVFIYTYLHGTLLILKIFILGRSSLLVVSWHDVLLYSFQDTWQLVFEDSVYMCHLLWMGCRTLFHCNYVLIILSVYCPDLIILLLDPLILLLT